MKVRATWSGKLPSGGDYLMSSQRPRFAYRIESYVVGDERFVPNPTRGQEPVQKSTLTIVVVKVSLRDVPEDAMIHAWKWGSRDSKKVMEVRHGE